jgi:hypothetical protein
MFIYGRANYLGLCEINFSIGAVLVDFGGFGYLG